MSPSRLRRTAAGARALLTGSRIDGEPEGPVRTLHRDGPFDPWLSLFDEQLSELDTAVAAEGAEALPRFRGLDADLWTVLLSRSYERYPAIRDLLPDLPPPELQLRWNGASGLELLTQGKVFYRRVRAAFARHAERSLDEARLLDFGCGWGRLTRFFIRELDSERLYGCDPVESILDVCRESRVPAQLARCDARPRRLPFAERFDLVIAFSVFTHLSEPAHEASLRAIHRSLAPGGLLIATIRSPGYLLGHELGAPLLEQLDGDPLEAFERPQYLFSPHPADPAHPQFQGGEMDYGETVLSLPYVRERWSPLYDLLDVGLLTEDMHQVVLTLRRRD